MLAFLLALCLGINQPAINSTELALTLLNPSCWLNWSLRYESAFEDQRYSPMLWKVNNPLVLQAGELAIKYPGRIWFVYNEPERKDQANTQPEIAADWFDKTYKIIKNVDPSAKVGCCGIFLGAEGITWMNTFNQTVTVKPDFYHIHIYALNKSDWQTLIDYWHSYNVENVPTYITETCGMYDHNQADLLNYVAKYQHPNIKQIYWFAAYPQLNWNCNLIQDNKLTNLGNIYKQNAPLHLTPTSEPPTVTPTITIQPLPTSTPTPTETSTPDDETTGFNETPEPDVVIIYVYQVYLPINFK